MNYLSDEWVEGQLAELDQHKTALLNAVGELRDTARLAANLRTTVESAERDVALLRSEIAALTTVVDDVRDGGQHEADSPEATAENDGETATALLDLRATITTQAEEIAKLDAAIAEIRRDARAAAPAAQAEASPQARPNALQRLRSMLPPRFQSSARDRAKRGTP